MGAGKSVLGLVGLGGVGQTIDDLTGDVTDGIGGAVDDYMNVGKTRFSEPGYQESPIYWGGNQNAGTQWAQMGMDNLGYGQGMQDWAMQQASNNRGPQSIENQDLSDREAMSKYMDQSGAMDAAKGMAQGYNAGSQAYLDKGTLDAMNMQTAAAGGARGGAALATAQQNAAANAGQIQAQAQMNAAINSSQVSQAGMGAYANLANTARSQDQNRLQMGNQNSQFNANLNDQYRLGQGQLANAFGQNQQGWYQAAQNPYNQQAQLANSTAGRASDNYNRLEDRAAGIATGNADARAAQSNAITNTVSGGLSSTLGKGLKG